MKKSVLKTLTRSAFICLVLTVILGLPNKALAAGTGTTADSGITATTSQVNEVAVVGPAVSKGDITFSAQTNGFTEVSEISSTGGGVDDQNRTAFEEKILSSVGTQQVTGNPFSVKRVCRSNCNV